MHQSCMLIHMRTTLIIDDARLTRAREFSGINEKTAVLVDTPIWIGHFRNLDPEFARLLNEGAVIMHPFVLGEIACGI